MNERSLLQDMWRGARGRCPQCEARTLFARYLKVAPACTACGEDFHHHRADDLPAYIVIVILGHVLIPLLVEVELRYSPPMWVHAALWLPAACWLTYFLLPRVKGAVVGLQWHMGMHGFAAAKKQRDAQP
jgi:uncharacterized protein (DUF983 family)